MEQSKAQPFFLYYAAWLVHTPIHSRSKELLEKYCKKLGVDMPTDPEWLAYRGQTNPYYCAMVEMLDHYIGMLVKYLEKTEDPRNPGKKLIDNTYILFTSDNGGMETGARRGILPTISRSTAGRSMPGRVGCGCPLSLPVQELVQDRRAM